jgi:hypothetical protein
MTLEKMLEIAKGEGRVRWRDGTTTGVGLEDSHLFGMVLVKRLPAGVEVLDLANEYDCEPAAESPGSATDPEAP